MAAIPQVVTKQPGAPQEMTMMVNVPLVTSDDSVACPAGLEYLTMVDQLLVKQQIELVEILFGCEMNNKYKIKNTMGQEVYFALEDTPFCTRYCCGPLRPFDLKITDNFQNEVIHLNRPLRCQGCCWPCCLQEMTVTHPRSGAVLGYVKEEWSFMQPKYTVENANCEPIFKIQGPFCYCRCCADVIFKIFELDEETIVGNITKQWTGIVQEMFTDADTFSVTFPMNLDPSLKAVLLGALFLIDFMYFETSQQNN